MCINVPRKGEKKAFWLFNHLPINTAYHCRDIVKLGNQMVYLSGVKTIDKQGLVEFIIIATYCFNSQTMVIYRDRWQTETMFKAMKSSGLNIEDTHLTDLVRISKLLCLVCIAFVCVYQVGVYRNANLKPIRIKKHGRKAHSFLKYGLNYVAHALLCAVIQDIAVIVRILSCT